MTEAPCKKGDRIRLTKMDNFKPGDPSWQTVNEN